MPHLNSRKTIFKPVDDALVGGGGGCERWGWG